LFDAQGSVYVPFGKAAADILDAILDDVRWRGVGCYGLGGAAIALQRQRSVKGLLGTDQARARGGNFGPQLLPGVFGAAC
jgi:hypothetical protein